MELLGQRFGSIRVTDFLGEGGMGAVYAGFDETLQRKVALKVLRQGPRLDAEARERLVREARALSKLEHPHICRIYDYIDSGDSALLVLEYIEGRTLFEAVQTKMSHAAKLRIAISIAEVLIAAHRAGIIHRDLKPENVMLTNAGQAKVLDFGLARWVNRPDASGAPTAIHEIASTAPSNQTDIMVTQAGVALGTPLYMSPEQARGEPLAAASDMFAFGLLLQYLFTGREPHPESLRAREVMIRVAFGKTDPVVGAGRDITALINALKMQAPADRPTAMEALERLRWIAAKPRRIVRRAAVAAAVAFTILGVWRYAVVLDRERTAANAARQEAARRRGQAEDLVDFMMDDLQRKLQPIGHVGALDSAADRATAYMSKLRPEQMSADELARNATTFRHLGEVRLAQGKLPDALQAFQQAQTIAAKALAKRPHEAQLRITLGEVQCSAGKTYQRMGNETRGRELMRVCRETLGPLGRPD